MNQIISQHGWGLDNSFWKPLKDQFISRDWLWQDNERGYFHANLRNSEWTKNESINSIKMAICHSLGIHLIADKTLLSATHAVLINSFYNFIPDNFEKELTYRSLKRMEKKIGGSEKIQMLKSFINRSFLPNEINTYFQKKYIQKLNKINTNNLKDDFQNLYFLNKPKKLFSEKCNILIIKSKNDFILKENAANNLIHILNKTQIVTPKVVEVKNQGHITCNLDIFKIIQNWLS